MQVYDLPFDFNFDFILKSIENYVEKFISSYPNNFQGFSINFLRIKMANNVKKNCLRVKCVLRKQVKS